MSQPHSVRDELVESIIGSLRENQVRLEGLPVVSVSRLAQIGTNPVIFQLA